MTLYLTQEQHTQTGGTSQPQAFFRPPPLTCSTLYELGPQVGTAEGGDQNLVEPTRRERCQDTLSHAAAQSDRRKHLHVVEQQLHFIVIHVAWSS